MISLKHILNSIRKGKRSTQEKIINPNPKHIRIIKKGTEIWNLWRNKNIVTPNLSGADLENLDLFLGKLWNCNLIKANLRYARLERADLFEANLFRADLSHANLSHADLSSSNLSSANLTGASLVSANLSRADLSSVNLSGADLSGANLSGAKLILTDLTDTKLDGADLSGAKITAAKINQTTFTGAVLNHSDIINTYFGETKFDRAVLTNSRLLRVTFENTNLYDVSMGGTVIAFSIIHNCFGLESVKVRHPCSIDFATLSRSSNLPPLFLRKIGLPTGYINYCNDFSKAKDKRLRQVILIHSIKDKSFASFIYEKLILEPVDVWYDERGVEPDSIKDSGRLDWSGPTTGILIFSDDSISSWWIENVISRFEEDEFHHLESKLILIALDGELFKSERLFALNNYTSKIKDFSDWKDHRVFQKCFEDLLEDISK